MNVDQAEQSQEVTTFEDYTIYTLQESVSGVLSIMERSKQIAHHWPDVPALVAAADLCRELAALGCYMDSLRETLGEIAGEPGEAWESARAGLQSVMEQMSDDVVLADEGGALVLFGSTLPSALHQFNQVIPALQEHVREKYQREDISGEEGE